MSTTATVRVMSPEDIAAQAGADAPFLLWPTRASFFAERAMRLRQLASGHAMGDFLQFMSALALAQQAALNTAPSVPIPDAAALATAARRGQPPMRAADWPRDPSWLAVLRQIVRAVQPQAPAAAQALLADLAQADDAALDALAQRLLGFTLGADDLAAAPFVGAALQVSFTHLLLEVQRQHTAPASALRSVLGRTDDATACPGCGSAPTASTTRQAGDAQGQRYLHCSLCGLGWHLPRTQCPHCLAGQRLVFYSLDHAQAQAQADSDEPLTTRAAHAAVQAESCEACGHYLKILHTERDPFVEPVADDLASLTLDLLVGETGAQRHGHNLLLFFGEADAATPPSADACTGAPPDTPPGAPPDPKGA